MPKQLALFLCIAFIVWLFARDARLRPMTSGGLWITLLWIAIIGTRPVSAWVGSPIETEEPFNYLEGSPLDRAVFLFLIVSGAAVLLRRNIDWCGLAASNRWIAVFFLYCLVSILWADYPFVSFKRWTKELGNLIMILILMSERDPVQATKALFSRFTYLVIPLSVVFIKYFPDLGRYYNNYTWTVGFGGIATNKNGLGSILLLCGMFLVWDLLEMRVAPAGVKNRLQMMTGAALLLMVVWLLATAQSSTAIGCFVLGAGVLFLMRTPAGQRQVKHLGTCAVAAAVAAVLLYAFTDLFKALVGMMGRDMTLTGRTDLWAYLLNIPVNPLLGTGYQSFWLGARMDRLWEEFAFHPVQAHNGYLETYLNLGVIGLCLLIAVIVSAGGKLRRDMLAGSGFGAFRFSFLSIAVLYNWTEAMFCGLALMWIILLFSAVTSPAPAGFSQRAGEETGAVFRSDTMNGNYDSRRHIEKRFAVDRRRK